MFNTLNGVEVVVFDFDGTAQNEIENGFAKRLIRGGTRMSNAFREFTYASAMVLARSRAARVIDSMLDAEAVKLMKELVTKGILVMIRTSNPRVDTALIKQRLEKEGLASVLVERVRPSEKGNDVNGVMPVVVSDGVDDVLHAARKGCTAFLLLKSYNRIRAMFVRVNEQIRVVVDIRTAGEEINRMPLSCNITSRQPLSRAIA